MILELSFNNYRMFKNGSFISFVADTRTKQLMSNSHEYGGKNVLKSIGLYGQNNIGKSNLIKLFKLIKNVFLGQEELEFNREIFGDEPITDVSITFKTDEDEGWLKLDFSYDSFKHVFLKEKLSKVKYYKTGLPRETTIIERDSIENQYYIYNFPNSSDILTLLPNKKLILYCLSLENDKFSFLKPYLESFIRFANSLVIIDLYNIPMTKTIDVLKQGDEIKKQFVLCFVKNADLSISDFYFNDNVQINIDGTNDVSEIALSKLPGFDKYKLFTNYGNKSVPSMLFDSSGTKKIEAIASFVYEAIVEGKTLIVDELDNGLHFKLSRAILSAFNSFSNSKGQLVFTAHDIELITCKHMMRKDQIYFSFRKEDLSSELFCLKNAPVESGGPRSAEGLLKHYNRGEFGYVPSPNFVKELSKFIKE